MADFLLVHNENSIVDLMQYYQIKPSKIICHPFPIMDLNPWIKADITKTIDFLFIGHLRCEKGINILLESWEKFSSLYPEANLYVVGNNPPNSGIDVTKYKKYNIKFVLHYVDDAVYAQYIASAKCVILPYLRGTNSGIPSSVYSLGSDLIVSDIPMFKNNPLIGKESYFECGNSNSLFEKMCSFYKELHKETSIKKERIDSYRQSFNNQVVQLYSQLLNK
jgi:glycosyltransferase involved in cell wall biosynthesis